MRRLVIARKWDVMRCGSVRSGQFLTQFALFIVSDLVITHRYSANDFVQGFETMRGGASGKVVLDWS